jgi:hypothetical protein
VLHKETDHRSVAFLDGPVERRIRVEVSCGIHISALGEKKLGAVDMAARGSIHERCVSTCGLVIHLCTLRDEDLDDGDVPTDLNGGMQGGHSDMVADDGVLVLKVRDLVAGGALVVILLLAIVGREFEAEGALHEGRRSVVRNLCIHLCTTIDEELADLGESTRCGHCQGREDADVKVTVVFPLDVTRESPNVVVVDGRGKCL